MMGTRKTPHQSQYRLQMDEKKYVGLMQSYIEKITPNVSDAWRADELYLKVKGNPKYLYALMDYQTRFWIAQQVADTKYTSNVRPLLENAKEQ